MSLSTDITQAAGYALVVEVAELDTNVVNQLSIFPSWKVGTLIYKHMLYLN